MFDIPFLTVVCVKQERISCFFLFHSGDDNLGIIIPGGTVKVPQSQIRTRFIRRKPHHGCLHDSNGADRQSGDVDIHVLTGMFTHERVGGFGDPRNVKRVHRVRVDCASYALGHSVAGFAKGNTNSLFHNDPPYGFRVCRSR